MKEIGKRLKERISEQHFEQQKIAELIDMSASQFSRNLSTGKFKIETLYKLSEILKTPIDYWFRQEEDKNSNINEDTPTYGQAGAIIELINQINDNSKRIDRLEKQLSKDKKTY